MKKKIIALILGCLITANGYGQKPEFALQLSNPLGLFQKVGGKFEYKLNQTGLLFCATRYYGTLPDYPGTQLGVEWRHYSLPMLNKRSENFFYAKLISGYQEERVSYGSSFFSHNYVPGGYYHGIGAGIGKHINYNHFFIEFNGGLKAVYSTVKQEAAFYLSGPASVIDLHFNLGYQF